MKILIHTPKTPILTLAFGVALLASHATGAQVDLKGEPAAGLIEKTLQQARLNQLATNNKTTSTKIGRFLLPVIQRQKASTPQRSTPMVRTQGETRVQVYISLRTMSPESINRLTAKGATIELTNVDLNKVQAWVDIETIEELAGMDDISKITVPSYAESQTGRVTTQGDAILNGPQLRALGATGKGIKVGVVSDGANSWRTAAQSGDLPNNLTTFGSCSVRADDPRNCRSRITCNEGTAMAEIIHDIAPDAELAVAAVSTSLEFIQQINRLANTFGANIIVDDLGFFGEPYFEDGDIARAVSALPSNILYFSSAGNSGNTHYERDYSTLNSTRHNFGVQNNTDDDAIGFAIRPNRGAFVLMQWADRYNSPNSNYDLFVFDQNSEVARSAGANSIAIEGTCIFNGGTGDAIRFAVVDKISGSNRRLEMFFLGASAIEYPIAAGSVFGHAGTRRAIAVGAINAGSNNVAFYSSHGPARVDFPRFEQRAKPDIAATDGVNVTGAGGFSSPFFGTSAAAPHAAAVAALLLSVGPTATPTAVQSALLRSASGGGSSASVGRGKINAIAAFNRLGIDISTVDPTSGDVDGARRPVVTPPIILLLDDEN